MLTYVTTNLRCYELSSDGSVPGPTVAIFRLAPVSNDHQCTNPSLIWLLYNSKITIDGIAPFRAPSEQSNPFPASSTVRLGMSLNNVKILINTT